MSKTTKNEHTGDDLVTKPASDLYRKNWDVIFGNKPKAMTNTVTNKTDILEGLAEGEFL